MKKFIITEEERSRILGMHQSATARQYLMEDEAIPLQAGPPVIGGGAAPGVMSIPNYNQFIVYNQSSGAYRLEANPFQSTMINYLGGEKSLLSGIIGKTILITKKKMYDYLQLERFALPNNSVDGVIIGSFVPKAWYVGGDRADVKNTHLFLFSKEITTNYSGDIEKPFIVKGGGTSEVEPMYNEERVKADLTIPTKGGAQSGQPYVDDANDIPKTLWPRGTGLKPGVDFIKIRLYDAYCPELTGYADYMLYLGFPQLGSMMGVTKAS
jgi:hypothetical protein